MIGVIGNTYDSYIAIKGKREVIEKIAKEHALYAGQKLFLVIVDGDTVERYVVFPEGEMFMVPESELTKHYEKIARKGVE